MTRTHPAPPPTPNPSADAAWRDRYGGQDCRLVAQWEITDDTLTPSQLKVTGRARLAELADQLELVVTEATWRVDGDWLHLVADVVAWPPADWDGETRHEWPAPEAAA